MTWLDLYIRVGALGGNVFFTFLMVYILTRIVLLAIKHD